MLTADVAARLAREMNELGIIGRGHVGLPASLVEDLADVIRPQSSKQAIITVAWEFMQNWHQMAIGPMHPVRCA